MASTENHCLHVCIVHAITLITADCSNTKLKCFNHNNHMVCVGREVMHERAGHLYLKLTSNQIIEIPKQSPELAIADCVPVYCKH